MIGIIILNYNGFLDTLECLQSVLRYSEEVERKIIVVDNFSTMDEQSRLNAYCKENEIIYIETGENIGYAAGNNMGIREAIKQGCEYVCILNNDTVIKDNIFSIFTEYLDNNTSVGFVGPLLINYGTDIVQSTGGMINNNNGEVPTLNRGAYINSIKSNIECDYVGGACICFKTSLINKVGFIPEDYFLYFEETDWCFQAEKNNYHNVILKDAIVEHKGGISISKHNGLGDYMIERSRAVFVKKNADSPCRVVFFIIRRIVMTILISIKHGPKHLKEISYMIDGIRGKVNKHYPFVKINSSNKIHRIEQ